MAKALGDVLTTCREQPAAGVCPDVTGPEIKPPGNIIDPEQLQNDAPTDRLWLYSRTSKRWVTITPPVVETCQKDGKTPGCPGVNQTLQSVGRFQSACRQQPGSPACGGGATSAQTPELTPGTPAPKLEFPALHMSYVMTSFTGGGTIPVNDDVVLIGPRQSSLGPLQPLRLFQSIDPSFGGTPPTYKLDLPSTTPAVTTPSVPVIDLVQTANSFQVTPGGVNGSIQLMIVVTINQVVQSSGKNDDFANRSVAPWLRFAPASWDPSARFPFAARTREPIEPAPAAETAQPNPPVQVFITSLGTSTGEAFEMQAFGADGSPVQLRGEGLVVQPLNDDNARRTQQEMTKRAKGAGARASSRLIGYCLEFLRLPPSKGMMFQVANNGLQQKFAPVRRILEASRLVRAAGQLVPDSEPEGYFHSISQWAIWTREQNFNQRSFGDAFVGHTRKNFEQAGGKWSDAVDQVVRKVVPNRWNDITKILQRAGAP